MNGRLRRRIFSQAIALLALTRPAWAGEAPEAPPKIVAATEEQIKAELEKENPEQKKLRGELVALAGKGQLVYYNSNADGIQRIYVQGCDGSRVKCLTPAPGPGGDHPRVSPDGKRVVFGGRKGLEPGKPVPDELKALPIDSQIPKGDQKWERSQAGSVWIMNADGSSQKAVALGCLPQWSPDGKQLVYAVVRRPWPNQSCVLDLEKNAERALLLPPGAKSCGFPMFSPDGGWVVGSNGATVLVKLTQDRGGVEKVTPVDGGHFCNVEFSPDGKYLLSVVDTDRDTGGWLMYAQVDLAAPKTVRWQRFNLGWANGSVNYYPNLSPCGKYMVYAHAERQEGLKSYSLRHSEELYVTRFPACEATVRITWNGGANLHPHWYAPAGAGSN